MAALLLLLSWVAAEAREGDVRTDSARIQFRVSRTELVPSLGSNAVELARLADTLRSARADSAWRLLRVHVSGSASPEGSIRFNDWLARERARRIFEYLTQFSQFQPLPGRLLEVELPGRDWQGLLRLMRRDGGVPFRDEALALVEEIARSPRPAKGAPDPLLRLKRLRGGRVYQYLLRELFPPLRASQVTLSYDYVARPAAAWPRAEEPALRLVPPVEPELRALSLSEPPEAGHTPFYLGLTTNMLVDALLVPNAGFDLYLGGGWSVNASWMYAWWRNGWRSLYWRAYGGTAELRRWFGAAASAKPLTGWHAGVFGGLSTYDFELGGRGYLGPKWSYLGGVSLGYALPVARRLNIDFTLGLGYMGGEYKKYVPFRPWPGTHYVWQSTHQRHWVGPTKVEASLVWLVGRGNYNRGKGRRRP